MPHPTCIVVIPIYKQFATDEETHNLASSLSHLCRYQITWVAPRDLDISFYKLRFGITQHQTFDPKYFASISSYSELLLSKTFYQQFDDYTFTLILQPDAIILRDDLDQWLSLPYDYIGAPWPDGWELELVIPELSQSRLLKSRSFVGNGGLSLRRNASAIRLLDEFPLTRESWVQNKWPEDLFYSLIGEYSQNYNKPNIRVASKFSIELDPDLLMHINGDSLPFGLHAPNKIAAEYWKRALQSNPKRGS